MEYHFLFDTVLKSNEEVVNKVFLDATIDKIICRYFTVTIYIDYFNLCDKYPEILHNLLITSLFHIILSDRVDKLVEKYFIDLNYENVPFVNKKQLYKIVFIHYLPISILQVNLDSIYANNFNVNAQNRILTKISANAKKLLEQEQKNHLMNEKLFSYNVKQVVLSGKVIKCKQDIIVRSRFYECLNILCQDKTFILQLRDIAYLVHEKKKNFIHLVDTKQKVCLNCKISLVENIKYKVFETKYYYILNYKNQFLSLNSKLIITTDNIFFGILKRRNNGQLIVVIHQSYTKTKERINYKYVEQFNQHITKTLLSIANSIFKAIKKNCDLHDCLLLIILNIFSHRDVKMLIFTSDSRYVEMCAVNFFKTKGICVRIYHSLKLFVEKPGLCIRDYGNIDVKNVDIIFHIPINNTLDYSYFPAVETFSVKTNKKMLNENDYQCMQEIFLKFRKKYKRIIEPERLLNTITYIYLSLYEFVQDSEQIQIFILKYFADKLL